MTEVKIEKLTIEGLKLYKEKSPSKFLAKFGNLDLDNLPENFDLDAHRKAIIAKAVKPSLIEGLGSDIKQDMKVDSPVNFEETKEEVKEIMESKETEKVGGEAKNAKPKTNKVLKANKK